MSIRAYKVIQIEHEPSETFNLTHNFDLLSRLGSFTEKLSIDGTGISTISREDVEEEISRLQEIIQKKWANHENTEALSDAKTILDDILADMEDEDYVEYYCF